MVFVRNVFLVEGTICGVVLLLVSTITLVSLLRTVVAKCNLYEKIYEKKEAELRGSE